MNKFLLLGLLLSCSFVSFSQNIVDSNDDERTQIRIKKQIIVNDLENQIKDVPFSAVRIFAKYKIASWLWRNGKDDIERAEHITVAAIDDLFKNKNEIPLVYFSTFEPGLFALLDRNATNAAKKLREKYKIAPDTESGLFDSWLGQKDGDKLAVDSAVRSLSSQYENNPELVFLIGQLQQQRSPELHRLLYAIVGAEETGRTRFTASIHLFLSGYFTEPSVPVQLQKRYLKVIVDKSRNAAQIPDGDADSFFWLLGRHMSDIAAIYPELLPEAGVVHAVLQTKVSRSARETQERSERIKNSTDKLAAMVAEAERTDERTAKYELYTGAARLALKEKKFTYSVDLIIISSEIDMSSNPISEEFRRNWRDQFFGEVVVKALESNDPDSANYSLKKMTDPIPKAESLGKKSKYYLDKGDVESGRSDHDEAIRFTANIEDLSRRVSILINLLSTAQRIDPSRVYELNRLAAKSINAIPTLNVEDKPETENYRDYVTKVMIINWNLLPALTRLAKVDRNGAADLAGRIDKKEVKIIADYVMAIESIDNGPEQKKEGSATLP